MRTTLSRNRAASLRSLVIAVVALQVSGAFERAEAAAAPPGAPQLLSPAGTWASPGLAERCPTFSWVGAANADGYELIVVRVGSGHLADVPALSEALEGSSLEVVLRRSLPAGATSWTPDMRRCLAPGEGYAWSLRVERAEEAGGSPEHDTWAEPAWLEVASAPSDEEVERALDVLRRHREATALGPNATDTPITHRRSDPVSPSSDAASLSDPNGASPASVVPHRQTSPGSAPQPGPASLTLSNHLNLASSSAVYKDGELFLWSTDQDGSSVALGRGNLKYTDSNNTGNTAIGFQAQLYNETGVLNTAVGSDALQQNTAGGYNVAIGPFSLSEPELGSWNVAIGAYAGQLVAGSNNIFINSLGTASDTNVLRIGESTGTSDRGLTKAFIHGIRSRVTGAGSATVFVDSTSQLGTRSCGSYQAAAVCPLGSADGPKCDRVPAGSFCDADQECGLVELNNCGIFDWYLRLE